MVVLLIAAGGILWWRQKHRPVPVVPPATAPPPVAPPPAPPPPPEPAIRNPIPAAAAPGGRDAIGARVYQAFALLMADKPADARAVLAAIGSAPAASPDEQQGLRWLRAMLADP